MMFSWTLLSALLLIGGADSQIQWPFRSGNESDYWGIDLDVEIGTPGTV
jgi:hypothetical protein